jgi:hypothetical protein
MRIMAKRFETRGDGGLVAGEALFGEEANEQAYG